MKLLREVTAAEVIAAHRGRAGRHVRAFVRGGPCPHRKWGETYDTYSTIDSRWVIQWWPGRWLQHVRFFGFLVRCDMCHWQGIRWPG